VQWRTLSVPRARLGPVRSLQPGYHDLATKSSSGAIDCQRHPLLRRSAGRGFLQRLPGWLRQLFDRLLPPPRWTSGSNLDAAEALENALVIGGDVLIFGEPFQAGFDMHNIHQNQGDPVGSQWWSDNGPWQDGGVVNVGPDGRATIFISKFSTQSEETDAAGHPA
jgi:hypothetical protein